MTQKTMLQFDYETVDGATVTAVLGQADDVERRWSEVAIVLGSRALVLRVDPDSDEISVTLEPPPEGTSWVPLQAMQATLGTALGWCWVGRNYRGYLDMFTVSFSGLEPQFLFIGTAAVLQVRRI